ncbi:hypothetical protein pb186bvf_005214 [Paramecium bursaria]
MRSIFQIIQFSLIISQLKKSYQLQYFLYIIISKCKYPFDQASYCSLSLLEAGKFAQNLGAEIIIDVLKIVSTQLMESKTQLMTRSVQYKNIFNLMIQLSTLTINNIYLQEFIFLQLSQLAYTSNPIIICYQQIKIHIFYLISLYKEKFFDVNVKR